MKNYSCVLFDLDGTLLPMDTRKFMKMYFTVLSEYLHPYGYNAEQITSGVWEGVKAMISNDGSCTNEERFWQVFSEKIGVEILERRDVIDSFYVGDFNKLLPATRPNPDASRLIRLCREHAGRVILATNPIFPANGVATRLSWIGLSPSDFDYVTTYENSRYCKPNPKYYTEIADIMKLDPSSCLMIGNDIDDDGAALSAGFNVHLITDCLIGDSALLPGFSHSTFAEVVRNTASLLFDN